jgi:hypothetical protein
MSQLALFEGSHIPRTAAHEALSRGDFGEASRHLRLAAAPAEAADANRLQRIDSALRATSQDPNSVHAAFASALESLEPRGFLLADEWFRLYAQRMAAALDAEPERCFRGWLGAHFAFATDRADDVRSLAVQLIATQPPGSTWIEAARFEFRFGDAARARSWIHAACLGSATDLTHTAPVIEHSGVPALDAAPSLPPLPAAVEDLFDLVRVLDGLPDRSTRWVAVVGEIDRVLAPVGEVETESPNLAAPDGDSIHVFLTALRAARRSRERDTTRGPEHCSDRELRARKRMQRVAPVLLERYLHAVRESLF